MRLSGSGWWCSSAMTKLLTHILLFTAQIHPAVSIPHFSRQVAVRDVSRQTSIQPSLSHEDTAAVHSQRIRSLAPSSSLSNARQRRSNRNFDSFSLVSPPVVERQDSFADLALPKCALNCFINNLITDGCKSESDFQCHCTTGDIIDKADSCVSKSCNKADREDARKKVTSICEEFGGGSSPGGGGDESSSSTSTGTRTSSTSSRSGSSTSTMNSPSSPADGEDPAATGAPEQPDTDPNAPAPAPGSPSGGSPPSGTAGQPTATGDPPIPTDTPLALLPTDRQLSAAAKAGISVSVSVFASAVLASLALYIRRLKRDLKAAKAAAGVPEDVWRASIQTATGPGVGRRKSWAGSTRGRRLSRGRESPVSPLSPRSMSEIEQSPSMLKKKRGHVLSVVVERIEEEDSSSLNRVVHEPVPGQKEGLVDPLELDGEYTGIVELPTSITPRNRSMERGRERGASLGEASRPRTAGSELGRIDEAGPPDGRRK